MKLYYLPGSCSLAVNIALREAGLAFDLDKVSRANLKTKSGEDFLQVNPKGYVPALKLDDGTVLTEANAILMYVAEQADTQLFPSSGTLAYYQAIGWLNYISTEVHKSHAPLFDRSASEQERSKAREKIGKAFDYLTTQLQQREHLTGHYSIADMYLYVVLGWGAYVNFSLADWPVLVAYRERIHQRDAVTAAREAEGL
jgi:glutathione S-transferase